MVSGIGQLARGLVSRELLPPRVLSAVLKRIAPLLPGELRLIADTSPAEAYKHYMSAKASVTSTAQTTRIMIHGRMFHLYKLGTVPVKTSINTRIDEGVPERRRLLYGKRGSKLVRLAHREGHPTMQRGGPDGMFR